MFCEEADIYRLVQVNKNNDYCNDNVDIDVYDDDDNNNINNKEPVSALLAHPERGLCSTTIARNKYNQQSQCHN